MVASRIMRLCRINVGAGFNPARALLRQQTPIHGFAHLQSTPLSAAIPILIGTAAGRVEIAIPAAS